jgi:hypothetical protein
MLPKSRRNASLQQPAVSLHLRRNKSLHHRADGSAAEAGFFVSIDGMPDAFQ